ncbi:transposase IS4 family protein [Paenibacillus curdlanolyticus YK9]|uniref:Transposase IS4 family protein n=2 Tax=Paenibacillus curdlanolyticus YK9 TaxID=717606 RepID=E0I4S5_9BACL|nr:IS4 family transposase [Paenibacillus curdlanolyticus]EFM10727.1 transposase IS4 family protein [Paenibacillus curdlanolyticus YK9]EFM12606.1 transposase IS4 family protein [Paenibacillus curdlanolyticus YK9]
MNKSTTFSQLVQTALPKEIVDSFSNSVGYREVGRKFTVYDLFLFFAQAASDQWKSYREGALRAPACHLVKTCYSTVSKKAGDVPFGIFKQLLHYLLGHCNRQAKRKLSLPKELLILDSTKITVGAGRLPWAPLKGERAGVKLHVAYKPTQGQPHRIEETTGNRPDLLSSDALRDTDYIIVADRAYAKFIRFDTYVQERQSFVIRIRDNATFHQPRPRKGKKPVGSPILEDFTCQIGRDAKRSKQRHRIIKLQDPKGNPVILATNLTRSAEQIAELYRARWQIETFFRWVKQHVNVPVLFGTSSNAVYSQLYIAMTVYVLLKMLFDHVVPHVHVSASLSLTLFVRALRHHHLAPEWRVALTTFPFTFPFPVS